jgi:hypothetical protein
MARGYKLTDWKTLDPLIDQLKAEGWEVGRIAQDLGVKKSTLVMHLRSREAAGTPKAHLSTLEHSSVPQEHLGVPDSVHLSTLEQTEPLAHPGTLEGHQEVLEDISQSVPDAPHVSTDEVHPSTPIVHPEVSPEDSSMVHSGVPVRQDHLISTPMVHPSTPSEEDWELWAVMKTRWTEIENMLADWKTRQALLSTPSSTPRHTVKKTYVVDSRYIEMIDQYAREQGVEIKDVVNLAFHEFFAQRDYLPEDIR